jgi:hypothetical protein
MSKLADDLENLAVPKANHFDDTHDAMEQRAILERIAPHLPALLRALEEHHHPLVVRRDSYGHTFEGAYCVCDRCKNLEGSLVALLEAAGHEQ